MRPRALLLTAALLALNACRLSPLPTEPPPLRDMDEPVRLKAEPDDEVQRLALAPGSFSGAYVKAAWFEAPEEPGQRPDALAVERIVENSPAAAAGLREKDLLLEARVGDGTPAELRWPAQWRKIEADTAPGAVLTLTIDRAGVSKTARLTLVARVQAAPRQAVETFREERRAGIVVRTGTEVEARAAGLGAGGGAVLIGLSANSPWRAAGLRFGDMIVAVAGEAVHDPQVLLGAIRRAPAESELSVEYVRGGARHRVDIPLTSRESRIEEVSFFGLFSYSRKRDRSETSILFGLFGYESTPAAWELTLLWFITFGGGDGDALREAKR